MRSLLIWGMLAGICAGLMAASFAWIFGEPQVDLAIAFEKHLRAVSGQAPEPELLSRAVQRTVGLVTGIVVFGCALGGIFALVFVCAYGRIGSLSPRATAAVLAAAGFVTLILMPQFKYPANPPAIGEPETIELRTALYFIMMAVSVISAIMALSTGRQLARRFGIWNGALAGGAAYMAAMVAAMLALPTVNNDLPSGFPATTLWSYRLASIGTEAVLWGTIGVVFGALVNRNRRF